MDKTTYSHRFYAQQAVGSERSAELVLPIVLRLLQPQSCIDVGCGLGTWLKVAKELGVPSVLGLDGAYVQTSGLLLESDEFKAVDLSAPLSLGGTRFDLALSLEVAEHLPAARAVSFVRDLCALSDVVLFSAAIPGQGGTEHLNEEPLSNWVRRFGDLGYRPFDLVRPLVWESESVEYFYRQNAIVFINSRRNELVQLAATLAANTPFIIDAVHPKQVELLIRAMSRPVSVRHSLTIVRGAFSRSFRSRVRYASRFRSRNDWQ